ncbi:hypothetical protein KP509_34G010700 [Ceratopteris richardii]|uniref:Tify domain-containing protein n=1 Tax=Ceratopteris richardii TaxID=49495 RepID=A0A8T2QIU6_CERRI|nr:hypothetical protein KP509_34G010700 [Ceratopteris richardii]
MAQCQNFFDDTSPTVCRSSCSDGRPRSPALPADEGEDHCLELRLGLSGDVSRTKRHEMVRPIPLYPSVTKQRSGNYAIAPGSAPVFKGHCDASVAEKVLFSKDSAFSTPPLVSREQVWQSLQSSKTVLGCDSSPTKPFFDESYSCLPGRRSTSVQIIMPKKEVSELGVFPIRRSCSNDIPETLLSRHPSAGDENNLDENPDPAHYAACRRRQDALERQEKKEMQAQRRFEARKRRRLLIEKQQKKGRENTGLNNNGLVASIEKASIPLGSSMDRRCGAEYLPLRELKPIKLGDDHIQGKNVGKDTGNSKALNALGMDRGDAEAGKVESVPTVQSGVGSVKMLAPMETEDLSSGSRHEQDHLSNKQQGMAFSDLPGHNVQAVADKCEDVQTRRSYYSESESSDAKEKESLEHESSTQKSSTENHLDCSLSVSTSPSSKPVLSRRTPASILHSSVKALEVTSTPCSSQFPSSMPTRRDGFNGLSPASSNDRISMLSREVPSNFTIKRSVGVFAEGKWSIPDKDPASSLPVRRTASNINEMMADKQCPSKNLEMFDTLSASHMKFATMFQNDRQPQKYGKSDLHENGAKLELGLLSSWKEKSVPESKASCSMGSTWTPSMIMKPTAVKQEEDMMWSTQSESHGACHQQAPGADEVELARPNERHLSESFSRLPQVTTTGRGPTGRTINGVMYVVGGHSVRIICRCHGKHMSPLQFVEHAGSNDLSNPLRSIVMSPSPLLNRLASTPV